MENAKTDIYRNLTRNNGIARMAVICSGMVVLSCSIIVFMMHKDEDRYVYGLSKDNSLLPLELIEKKDIEGVYQKGHVAHFLSLFYTIDQYNYRQQVEKALWLINDGSGKALYDYYTSMGHYNRLVQTSSHQYVKDTEIAIDQKGNFRAALLLGINKPNQEKEKLFKVIVEGQLTNEGIRPNYPKNPYGYMIYNYRETERTELTE